MRSARIFSCPLKSALRTSRRPARVMYFLSNTTFSIAARLSAAVAMPVSPAPCSDGYGAPPPRMSRPLSMHVWQKHDSYGCESARGLYKSFLLLKSAAYSSAPKESCVRTASRNLSIVSMLSASGVSALKSTPVRRERPPFTAYSIYRGMLKRPSSARLFAADADVYYIFRV